MNLVISVAQVLAILPEVALKMDSFEELGLNPELVEALAAEGIEQPTSIQKSVIPFVYRENNAVSYTHLTLPTKA